MHYGGQEERAYILKLTHILTSISYAPLGTVSKATLMAEFGTLDRCSGTAVYSAPPAPESQFGGEAEAVEAMDGDCYEAEAVESRDGDCLQYCVCDACCSSGADDGRLSGPLTPVKFRVPPSAARGQLHVCEEHDTTKETAYLERDEIEETACLVERWEAQESAQPHQDQESCA